MKTLNQRAYFVGGDHLRAFAAVLVVLYHGADVERTRVLTHDVPLAVVLEGHSAVSLFLVLSGFLFATAARGHDIDYLAFLRNRFLRVYPLYLVVALAAVAALPHTYRLEGLAQALLFQANLPGGFQAQPISNPFWTIAVECQFYLVFPVLHRVVERDGVRYVLPALLLATLLRVGCFAMGAVPQDVIYWHLGGRIDQFLIGMLAAQLYARIAQRRLPWGVLSALSAAAVVTALLSFHRLGSWDAVALWKATWPTIEGLVWAALVVTYLPFARTLPRLLSALLAAVGSWSYSIYLLHVWILEVAKRVFPIALDADAGDRIVHTVRYGLPLTLVIAALSFRIIERPFMELRVRYLRARSVDPGPGAE